MGKCWKKFCDNLFAQYSQSIRYKIFGKCFCHFLRDLPNRNSQIYRISRIQQTGSERQSRKMPRKLIICWIHFCWHFSRKDPPILFTKYTTASAISSVKTYLRVINHNFLSHLKSARKVLLMGVSQYIFIFSFPEKFNKLASCLHSSDDFRS